MNFAFLTNDQKAAALRDFMMFFNENPERVSDFFSIHPELKDKEAAIFSLSQADALRIHYQMTKQSVYEIQAMGLVNAATCIADEIGDDTLYARAEDQLALIMRDMGNNEAAYQCEERAKMHRGRAIAHSDRTRKFKDMSAQEQQDLVIPLINILFDENQNYGNNYLYAHPVLLHEDAISWALELAGSFRARYRHGKADVDLRSSINLATMAYTIGIELHNKSLLLMACSLLSDIFTDAGMKERAKEYQEQMKYFRDN